jgi:hypothetical protein
VATKGPVLDQHFEAPQEDDEQTQTTQTTKKESNEEQEIGWSDLRWHDNGELFGHGCVGASTFSSWRFCPMESWLA